MKEIVLTNSRGKQLLLSTEVARTPIQKLRGLMFRRHLPDQHGMLFLFNRDSHPTFWTLFTWIPLEAVFIDSRSRIVDIVAMPPHRPGPFRSSHPCEYVLEVNRGFCKKNRVEIGSKVKLGKLL